jgi:Ca2+-binding RTX toxin-like protein
MRRSQRHCAGRIAAVSAPLLLLALFPAVTHAADVSVQGGTLRYTSGSAANSVHIALRGADRFEVTDSKTDVNAGSGCTSTGQRQATCPTAGVTAIAIDVGSGADSVTIAAAISTPATINTGGGKDVLGGGSGNDRLEGGPGPDILDGGAGNDTERGGDGNDVFSQGRGPNGADSLSGGGGGGDRVGYGKRAAGLAISLDGAPNDGDTGAGEGDNVGTDVEHVSGGSGFDTIAGSEAKNRLDGGPGGDFIDGRAGVDALNGGSGADRIGSRDLSADKVDCGADGDRVRADSRDHVGNCEAVAVSAPIRVRRLSSRLTSTGAVRLLVSCGVTAFGPCSGRVFVRTARRLNTRLGLRRVRVGSRAFQVDPGTSEEVRVHVRPAVRRLIRRHRRLVRAFVRGGDSAGPAAGVSTLFVLRR